MCEQPIARSLRGSSTPSSKQAGPSCVPPLASPAAGSDSGRDGVGIENQFESGDHAVVVEIALFELLFGRDELRAES